ncbi:MAG: YciI family protein [Actinomycetota bacterium]
MPNTFVIRAHKAKDAGAKEKKMQYLLLIYGDESAYGQGTPAEQEANMKEWNDYTVDLRNAGVFTAGEALHPTATAKSVRDQNGTAQVVDGPFAETKEQLGGFYLLDTPDLDTAIMWAHRCPGSKYGTIEVREVQVFPTQ